MIKQCTKASNGDLKSADRQIILEQLKALGDEVYSTGDADYAGRYVFTGYRTDTSLSFDKEYNTKYEITEQLDNSSITQLTKIDSPPRCTVSSWLMMTAETRMQTRLQPRLFLSMRKTL